MIDYACLQAHVSPGHRGQLGDSSDLRSVKKSTGPALRGGLMLEEVVVPDVEGEAASVSVLYPKLLIPTEERL